MTESDVNKAITHTCLTSSSVEVWQRRGSGIVSTSPVVKCAVTARL